MQYFCCQAYLSKCPVDIYLGCQVYLSKCPVDIYLGRQAYLSKRLKDIYLGCQAYLSKHPVDIYFGCQVYLSKRPVDIYLSRQAYLSKRLMDIYLGRQVYLSEGSVSYQSIMAWRVTPLFGGKSFSGLIQQFLPRVSRHDVKRRGADVEDCPVEIFLRKFVAQLGGDLFFQIKELKVAEIVF